MITKQIKKHNVKAILGMLLPIGALCLGITACSGDDLTGYVPTTESVIITQNDLVFTAAGNSATVTVANSGDIAATVNANWCTATVSGSTVTITAEPNHSFEGRTALLTITAGKASKQLPVQQMGMILDMPLVTNGHHSPTAGDEFSVPLQHNLPITLSASQPWIHPVVTDNELRVTVDDNTGGHIRRGIVICTCGDISDTLHIAQFDTATDVVGTYYMAGFLGGDTQTPTATRFEIVQRHDSLFLHWTTERYMNTYTHVPFDPTTCTLYIPSNFTLYSEARNTHTAYFYDTEGRICTATGAGAKAELTTAEGTNSNYAVLTAHNWPGHTLYGFLIRVVALVPTNLIQITQPTILRIGPVDVADEDINF